MNNPFPIPQDKPICPLISIGAAIVTDGMRQAPCQMEQCAWWDKEHTKCFIVTMARAVKIIEEDGISTYK